MIFPAILLYSTALFSAYPGGDTLEIYVNGKQLLQQFIHMDKSVKTVSFPQPAASDKVEIYYSHCGTPGTNRVLTLKDDKNNLVKEFKFPDTKAKRASMTFTWKDLKRSASSKLNVFYQSKEIPTARLIAVLSPSNQNLARK